jgi:hypothetical protein
VAAAVAVVGLAAAPVSAAGCPGNPPPHNLNHAQLAGCNLAGYNLAGVNLSNADLTGANLAGANLNGANVQGAKLTGADLTGALLSGVNLKGADLSGAKLDGATLTGSNLNGANLTNASAVNANLGGANFHGTTLTGANLSGASGIPSSVVVPTIASFSLGSSSITQGGSTTLTAVFSHGTGSVSGVGAVTSGVPVTVSPTSTTTYVLTVTASNGVIATSSQTLTVVPLASPQLLGASMSDTDGGGWFSCSCPGLFHLFITEGSDPNGTILDPGYLTGWPAITLADGSTDFTLIGNDNSGLEQQGTPQLTLNFDNNAYIQVSTLSPSGSTTVDGRTVTVSNFTYTPWQLTGLDRVDDVSDNPDGIPDTIAHLTITVS